MWLMKQQMLPPLDEGNESLYNESCEVLFGHIICEHPHSVGALEALGYRVILEFEELENIVHNVTPMHALVLAMSALGPLKKIGSEKAFQLKQMIEDEQDPAEKQALLDEVQAEIDRVIADAAPVKSFVANPLGVTSADAMRLIGVHQDVANTATGDVTTVASVKAELDELKSQVAPVSKNAPESAGMPVEDAGTGEPAQE